MILSKDLNINIKNGEKQVGKYKHANRLANYSIALSIISFVGNQNTDPVFENGNPIATIIFTALMLILGILVKRANNKEKSMLYLYVMLLGGLYAAFVTLGILALIFNPFLGFVIILFFTYPLIQAYKHIRNSKQS